MRRILGLLFMILASTSLYAQQEIKSKDIPDFKHVDLSGRLTVKMVKSDTPSIEIKLVQTQIKNLDWNVNGGVLTVRLKPGGGPQASGEVLIHYKEIDQLNVSGANVVIEAIFDSEILDVSLEAGAVLSMEVNLQDLYLKVAGNSAVNLSGTAKYYTLLAGARSKADTRQLMAQDVRVDVATGAEVYVCANERLQVKAATGASVFYRGEPEILRTTSRTMATINSIGK